MASFHHRIKSGKKGTAVGHSRYISNEHRDDLIYTSYGNLPSWANDPVHFWRMANAHERANGAVYREHEIALPNELSNEQNIELAERIARKLVGNKPFQLAVHVREGRLEGISNPHMHLMYSARNPDGIDRSPEQMFSRFNPKRPEAGGCRKDNCGRSPLELRESLISTRRAICDEENQALAKNGHEARVDHRSLHEQGVQRPPERRLGPALVRRMTPSEKMMYSASRRQFAVTISR